MTSAEPLPNGVFDLGFQLRGKLVPGAHLQEEKYSFILILGSSLPDTEGLIYGTSKLLHDCIDLSGSKAYATGVKNSIAMVNSQSLNRNRGCIPTYLRPRIMSPLVTGLRTMKSPCLQTPNRNRYNSTSIIPRGQYPRTGIHVEVRLSELFTEMVAPKSNRQ